MSRVFFRYPVRITGVTQNPETLLQINAATNHRVVLHNVEIQPLGATPATKPMEFDFIEQSTDGTTTLVAATDLVKNFEAAGETIQTQIRLTAHGAEPTSVTPPPVRDFVTVHQQGSRIWRPGNPFQEIMIPGGKQLGFRFIEASGWVNCLVVLHLEE